MRFFHWRILKIRVDGSAYWHYDTFDGRFPTRVMAWRDSENALCFILSVLGTGFSVVIQSV